MNERTGDPTVTVVVPAWNCAKLVAATLTSVVRQSYASWEVIVVDDGSTDDTLAVLHDFAASHPGIRVLTQPNGGPSTARNTGARAASPASRYLMFLDADDLLEPDALETFASYLDAHEDVGLLHCDCTCVDVTGETVPPERVDFCPSDMPRFVPCGLGARKLRRDEIETPFVAIYNLAPVLPSLAFLRRSVFERAGGWDESFKQMFEDTDLWLRMALVSRVHYVPRALVRYRRHPGQSTDGARAGEFQDRLGRLLDRWHSRERLDERQRAIVREAEAFRMGGLALYKNLRSSWRYLHQGRLVQSLRSAYGALRVLAGANRRSAIHHG